MSKRILCTAGVIVALTAPVWTVWADDKAKPIDDEGFIREWLLLCPIPLGNGEDYSDAVDKEKVKDEAKLAPKDGDKIKVGDKELTWKKQAAEEYFFDFNKSIGDITENAVGYAVTYVVADEEKKDVTLKIGSDDGFKVWLNGNEEGKGTDGRALEQDQNAIEKVTLNKGTNVIVFKVTNGQFEWKGCARFVDKDGKPVKGLKVELKK
jgi:hypothetical protein